MTLKEQLEHWSHVHEEALLHGTDEDIADAYGIIRLITHLMSKH